jgi:glycerol-3-phosphate O-acyltransferase
VAEVSSNALIPVRVRGLVGRGMPRRLGPLLGPFARRFLDHIPFPAEMAARLKELERDGAIIVWVHRARNPVEHLALARVVEREALPRARYVGGLHVIGLQPFWLLPAWLRGVKNARREELLLERCVTSGQPAEIFLRRPMHLLSTTSAFRARFMEVLVRVQRSMQRPIVLVPVFLALKQRPGKFEPTPLDAIFGTVEEPGLLRALGRVLVAGENARFEVSEPVDLKAFVEEHERAEGRKADDILAKKVRWSILHHLARVERVAHGPPLKSRERMRDEVLKDHSLRAHLAGLAATTGLAPALLEKKARAMHDEIAARFDVDVTRFISRVLDIVWNRIYDGIHFDPAEVERLRTAAHRGPLVLVPSHRSHVDYLVMSQVMLKAGLLPPLVAAGDNLSFFPLGPIFRRGGAYFLRRSFKGDVLYGAVFRAYVRRLFIEGFTQEFFIEGGRSRTGKTLPPKLGLLSMLVDAYLESREEDAIFVPCHIAYERVIEAGSYVGELGGKKKEKESARALVKTAGVLKGRYGRVYVTFDEPISLSQHLASRGLSREGLGEDDKRGAVQTLGHRIVYGINRCGVVTSTSIVVTALFGFRRKGLDEDVLLQGARALVAHLDEMPAGTVRWQPGLRSAHEGGDDVGPHLRAALERLVEDGLVIRARAGDRVLYQMAPEAVFPLDTFKNQILHHFVPESIVATALRAAGARKDTSVPREKVKEAARALSRIFKLEFIFRVGTSFDELFDEAVRSALAAGLLTETAEGLGMATPEARGARHFAASLIANFVEAYHACFVELPRLSPRDQKALVVALLESLKARVLAGEVVCAEAASKAIVENAVALLQELGVLGPQGIDEAKRPLLEQMTALLASSRPSR